MTEIVILGVRVVLLIIEILLFYYETRI